MTSPIAFTAATLSGPIETIGYVSDFGFSGWPLLGNNAYYRHDGQDFIRLKHDGTPCPESGGNFSWLFRKPRWEQLLMLEATQFGAFQAGDMIRISEDFLHYTGGTPPRTPCWHSDQIHSLPDIPMDPNSHMYLIGSRHRHLNTEIIRGLPALIPEVKEILALNAIGAMVDAPELTRYLKSFGGARKLNPGEVVRSKLSQPHRTSQQWAERPAYGYEFNRMKVLRAIR